MHRKLTTPQIAGVCLTHHRRTPNPPIREVMADLRRTFGSCGRTARVSEILKKVVNENPCPATTHTATFAAVQKQLAAAESRAKRAEDLERHHQDFWAARYQAKLTEHHHITGQSISAAVPFNDYLQLYRQAAELARRLALYEDVGPLMEPVRPVQL